jgi:uncharacterized membrane protein YeaQ/YmgE (transglycosylase-associated protein family)
MINFIVWIILGGVLGWIASMIMGTNAQQGTLMNIVVGIVGAFLAVGYPQFLPARHEPLMIGFPDDHKNILVTRPVAPL